MPPPSIKSNRPLQFSLLSLLVIMLVAGILFGLIAFPIAQARRERLWRTNLKEIAMAMHNYHDTYGCLPPAYVPDGDGKPLHSWRVLLLEMMPNPEAQRLYEQYDFDQPWDSPKNLGLAKQMPPV
jgi:hypothetical protein